MAVPERPSIKTPLTPELLVEEQALPDWSEPTEFDPNGAWTLSWRLWITRGQHGNPSDQPVLWGASNAVVGQLSLTRQPLAGGRYKLQLEQRTFTDEGVERTVTASIDGTDDALCSPTAWRLAVRFTHTQPLELPAYDLDLTGHVDRGQVALEANQRRTSFATPPPLADRWTLLAAASRWADQPPTEFDLLEELSVLKPGARLFDRGRTELAWPGRTVKLRRYDLFAQGLEPTELYLDEHGRVVLVTEQTRASILDADPRPTYEKWRDYERNRTVMLRKRGSR